MQKFVVSRDEVKQAITNKQNLQYVTENREIINTIIDFLVGTDNEKKIAKDKLISFRKSTEFVVK